MKLNNNKSYFVDIDTYGTYHSAVLYHMPNAEMEKHLDDDDPKCFYDMEIDRQVTFCYSHPKDEEIKLWNGLIIKSTCDIETLLFELIGDRMEFVEEPKDFNYTIIAVNGIYECYWDEEDKKWWYKNENIFKQYLEKSDEVA